MVKILFVNFSPRRPFNSLNVKSKFEKHYKYCMSLAGFIGGDMNKTTLVTN